MCPYKPIADEDDYPERSQSRPKDSCWIAMHQEQNLERILGRYRLDMITEILKEREDLKCG
jgi:hypothetical protein